VRDSDRILGILSAKSKRAEEGREPIREHLVVTRYSPSRVESGEMLSIDDIQELLGIRLLGIIPESTAVLQASNSGVPVVRDEISNSGQAYQDLVARFLGEERPMRFMEPEKKGLLKRLFGT
jgi:septum site-determining protein MinD